LKQGIEDDGQTYMYSVPGGLTIEEGKTDYTIELGKAFKAPQ
jgi:hypothetical protein